MRRIKKNIVFYLLCSFVLFFNSCSTKKKTWAHKQYHNTTAKYNGYYNSKKSINQGVKKLKENHKDDYTKTLQIYKTGELTKNKSIHGYMDKAIKKSSIVIQRHSINIRGKEYCKWIDENYLLVGMAYFYKGDFDEAIKTFQFVKNEYKKNITSYKAQLWLVRAFVEKKDFSSAELELTEINNNRRFPKKIKSELQLVSADFYLKQDNHPLALDKIQQALKLIKRKNTKTRLNYIAGQIYYKNKNHKKARDFFQSVIKSNPEYEMVFNAKMNLARSLDEESNDVEKIKKQLIRMTKDDKNIDYLDQIYYTLAKIDLTQKDTGSAVKNYIISTEKSINNNKQKTLSFIDLADIYFNKEEYAKSKQYHDSIMLLINTQNQRYTSIKKRKEILTSLVFHLETINLEDSLQALAKLPLSETNQIIQNIIDKQLAEQKEKTELERIKQQAIYENGRYGSGEQFGAQTSGGKWYFYNPSTLSFGLSEFRKKWGKRKLEDDWRRKNKETNTAQNQVDSTAQTSKEEQGFEGVRNLSYYMKKIPRTKERIKSSNNKIKESLYEAGIIYKEQLNRYKKSNELFQDLIRRFKADTIYSPLSYYNIYLNNKKIKNFTQAEKTKQLLFNEFPNSIYAKMLKDTTYTLDGSNNKNNFEKIYEDLFVIFNEKKYKEVVQETETIKNKRHQQKIKLLRAISLLKVNDTIRAKKELRDLKKQKEDVKIQNRSKEILQTLENPEKMLKSNKQAKEKSRYLYDEKKQHITVFIFPKNGTDVNYFKTLLSDYHKQEYSNEVFEINAILFGLNKHLVSVRMFESKKQAMKYYTSILDKSNILQELKKQNYNFFVFSEENFQEFYKTKNIKEYIPFFEKNYLQNKD